MIVEVGNAATAGVCSFHLRWQAGAPGAGALIQDTAAQFGAATKARLAGAAITDEVLLIVARAFEAVVVAQGAAAAFDAGNEYLAQRCEQALSAGLRDRAGRRIDAGQKQRFVGVDVADPGHQPLVQQLRLDSLARPSGRPPERDRINAGVQRLWTHRGERGQLAVVAAVTQRDPTEPSHVMQAQHLAVVEAPPSPHIGIVERHDGSAHDLGRRPVLRLDSWYSGRCDRRIARREAQPARHAEMGDQSHARSPVLRSGTCPDAGAPRSRCRPHRHRKRTCATGEPTPRRSGVR